MAQYDGKIFGIGFYKTGTTTLYDALRTLGYHTINGDKLGSYPGADDGATFIRQIDAGDYRLPTFEMFDAFTDNPYFHIWRRIYEMFPEAKYILTVRDEERWIASCVKFYRNRRIRPMRVWMFGPHANPARDEASRQARGEDLGAFLPHSDLHRRPAVDAALAVRGVLPPAGRAAQHRRTAVAPPSAGTDRQRPGSGEGQENRAQRTHGHSVAANMLNWGHHSVDTGSRLPAARTRGKRARRPPGGLGR